MESDDRVSQTQILAEVIIDVVERLCFWVTPTSILGLHDNTQFRLLCIQRSISMVG